MSYRPFKRKNGAEPLVIAALLVIVVVGLTIAYLEKQKERPIVTLEEAGDRWGESGWYYTINKYGQPTLFKPDPK